MVVFHFNARDLFAPGQVIEMVAPNGLWLSTGSELFLAAFGIISVLVPVKVIKVFEKSWRRPQRMHLDLRSILVWRLVGLLIAIGSSVLVIGRPQ